MIIDSHCHLASNQFKGDLEEVLERAKLHKISKLISIGTDLEDSKKCVNISNKYHNVFATVGVHPCSVTDISDTDWLQKISDLSNSLNVVAIGEIGLDFFHSAPNGWDEKSYRNKQKEFFIKQLELASALNLNVVVHQRDKGEQCWKEIKEIIAPFKGKLRAVFHCFTHSWEAAKPLIDDGHLISFTGVVTFKNATLIQECVTQCPLDSFMVETDSPYLAPIPFRGKRCEPMHVRSTTEFIANLRYTSIEEIAARTSKNADSFFKFERIKL